MRTITMAEPRSHMAPHVVLQPLTQENVPSTSVAPRALPVYLAGYHPDVVAAVCSSAAPGKPAAAAVPVAHRAAPPRASLSSAKQLFLTDFTGIPAHLLQPAGPKSGAVRHEHARARRTSEMRPQRASVSLPPPLPRPAAHASSRRGSAHASS
ncbi:MAG: hypothetical protein EOO41_03290, partial [Methanobacteriota archaeon]